MSLTRSLVAAAFAAAITSPFLAAQAPQAFSFMDTDRKASVMLAFVGQEAVVAGAAINFTSPVWKDSNNALIDKLKGQNVRLGKNWWTTLDTISPLEIGGAKIAPGAYYLGLHCDKDGKFSLLVIDAGKAMKNGWVPFDSEPWKADVTAPLTLAKDSLKDTVEKMEIELATEKTDPTTGKFSVRWGKHELSAPVKVTMAGKTQEAAGDKKEEKKEKKDEKKKQ
jgi:hypothetical protein